MFLKSSYYEYFNITHFREIFIHLFYFKQIGHCYKSFTNQRRYIGFNLNSTRPPLKWSPSHIEKRETIKYFSAKPTQDYPTLPSQVRPSDYQSALDNRCVWGLYEMEGVRASWIFIMTSPVYWLWYGGHTQVRLSGLQELSREEGGSELIAHIRDIKEAAGSRQLDRWRWIIREACMTGEAVRRSPTCHVPLSLNQKCEITIIYTKVVNCRRYSYFHVGHSPQLAINSCMYYLITIARVDIPV